MAEKGFKRKLTAILSADVEGYSRLMDNDEEATVRTLTAFRGVMDTLIQQHRGRVVDTTGDNLLAEFASAVDAVNCAMEVQQELAERNAELSEERKMHFRIGINVGDVVEEQDRIYGDGVNIAARVEGLSEAGGICISGRVYDHVENKLHLDFEFLGVSYRESGQYKEAIATLKEGIARHPEWVLSHYALVTVYCATGQYEEARAEAQEILRIDPPVLSGTTHHEAALQRSGC